MKKKIKVITSIALISTVGFAGVAFALLGGSVFLPQIAQGLAGGTSNPCQTNAVNFIVGAPVWDGSVNDWLVSSVDYQNIDTLCTNLGTVDLELKIVDGTGTISSGNATNMTTSGGTIPITPALSFDTINGSDFNYLVVG